METTRRARTVCMPVLPLRGMMVFPHMVLHFDVGRPKSVAALEKAMTGDQKIFWWPRRMRRTTTPPGTIFAG